MKIKTKIENEDNIEFIYTLLLGLNSYPIGGVDADFYMYPGLATAFLLFDDISSMSALHIPELDKYILEYGNYAKENIIHHKIFTD